MSEVNKFFDIFADTHANRCTHRSLLINGLDNKLLVVERDVADLAPREPDLGSELVQVPLVDVEPQGVHTQPQVRALLVLDAEVVDAVHFQVLGDLQVLQHSVLSGGGEGRGGEGRGGEGRGGDERKEMEMLLIKVLPC